LLCALKPHFFAPFGIALLLWCVTTKKGYRILAGFGVALIGSCVLAYALDPHAWSQYSEMMRMGGALNEVGPRLSAEPAFRVTATGRPLYWEATHHTAIVACQIDTQALVVTELGTVRAAPAGAHSVLSPFAHLG